MKKGSGKRRALRSENAPTTGKPTVTAPGHLLAILGKKTSEPIVINRTEELTFGDVIPPTAGVDGVYNDILAGTTLNSVTLIFDLGKMEFRLDANVTLYLLSSDLFWFYFFDLFLSMVPRSTYTSM